MRPHPLRSGMARLFHKGYSRLRGFNHEAISDHLFRMDASSPQAIEQWQWDRISTLLPFWYDRIPFYQEQCNELARKEGCTPEVLLEKITSDRSLDRLPLMDKQRIRDAGESLHVQGASTTGLRRNHTGGSTGEVLHFRQNRVDARWLHAGVELFRSYLDLDMGSRTVQIWGSSIEATGADSLRRSIQTWLSHTQFHSTYDLGAEQRKRIVKDMYHFDPELLIGYPSSLTAFLEDVSQLPAGRFPSLKAIWCASETLLPGHRSDLESMFNAEVFNNYGCREFGPLAMECKAHEGLHLNEGSYFFEFLPVGGGFHEIVVTDLKNEVMPLIRYRIGDVVQSLPRACSCGRATRVVAGLEGRTFDLIRGRDGEVVTGTFWTLLLRSRPGVRRFQVIQEEYERFTINLETEHEFDEHSLDHFRNAIAGQFTQPVTVQFNLDAKIAALPSGKFRFIQSRLKGNDDREPRGT